MAYLLELTVPLQVALVFQVLVMLALGVHLGILVVSPLAYGSRWKIYLRIGFWVVWSIVFGCIMTVVSVLIQE